MLLISRLNGIFRYLLASELIEVVRNAGHKAELRKEIDLELFVASTFALNTQEGLFGVTDSDIVFAEVIFPQGHISILQLDAFQVLEDHLLNAVITSLPIIGHHNFALQLTL